MEKSHDPVESKNKPLALDARNELAESTLCIEFQSKYGNLVCKVCATSDQICRLKKTPFESE